MGLALRMTTNTTTADPSASTRRRRFRRGGIWLIVIAVCGWGWGWANRRSPVSETEIFQGITYGCDRLQSDAEGYGLVHWVRIDLTAPGIELHVTPLDPAAVAQGWQYRLRTTDDVVKREGLAVAINGGLFASKSSRFPGSFARSIETMVADHQVSHHGQDSYLLWFSDDLTPHQETTKRPSDDILSQARWGVSGQDCALGGGVVNPAAIEQRNRDSRTGVGIDRDRRLLFLAVFECATPSRAYEKLAALGAVDGMLLDGGSSTEMTLGKDACNVRPGNMIGVWGAVATHFGVRAKPLRKP